MATRNRGKGKPKLRDHSRQWPSLDELVIIRSTLAKTVTPPIVVAILGASMIEYALEKMIRPKFRHQDDETWKKLTADNGPLSSFYGKIVMGQAFGFYDGVITEALHTIRRIRNAFAHAKVLIDFETDSVKDELRSITLPSNPRTRLYRRLKEITEADDGYFQVGYALLCVSMENQLLRKQLRIAQTRATSRRRRATKKNIQQSPYYNYLAAAITKDLPPQKGAPTNMLKAWLDQQSADPRSEAQRPSPATPPPGFSRGADKTDK